MPMLVYKFGSPGVAAADAAKVTAQFRAANEFKRRLLRNFVEAQQARKVALTAYHPGLAALAPQLPGDFELVNLPDVGCFNHRVNRGLHCHPRRRHSHGSFGHRVTFLAPTHRGTSGHLLRYCDSPLTGDQVDNHLHARLGLEFVEEAARFGKYPARVRQHSSQLCMV